LTELAASPDVIVRYHVDEPSLPPVWRDMGEEGVRVMREIHSDQIIMRDLSEEGLLRTWQAIRPRDTSSFFERWFDRNTSFLTAPAWAWEQRVAIARDEIEPKEPPRINMYGFKSTGEVERWGLDAGLEIGLPFEVPDNAAGLLIHITSLMENRYEHRLTNRLRSFGFAAAYIESDPFLDGPNEFESTLQYLRRAARQRELMQELDDARDPIVSDDAQALAATRRVWRDVERTFDQARTDFPAVPDGFQIGPDTDVPALGRYIAQAADAKIAEHAYAAAAVVRAADRLHPHLAKRPVVIVAYSAGTLAAPAVAAKIATQNPDRRVLLILVGGGGDLLTIIRGSVIGSDILRLAPRNGPQPTPVQIAQLQATYLEHARLDPLRVAPALRSIPTLHIYASSDTAVPTAAAEAFNTAHGGVDRLVHNGDHDTLFYFMSQHAGRIRSWLRTHGVD
jgi:hypothetical protein